MTSDSRLTGYWQPKMEAIFHYSGVSANNHAIPTWLAQITKKSKVLACWIYVALWWVENSLAALALEEIVVLSEI